MDGSPILSQWYALGYVAVPCSRLYYVLLFHQPVEAYIYAVFIASIPGGQHVN